jgi:hypothetical protein
MINKVHTLKMGRVMARKGDLLLRIYNENIVEKIFDTYISRIYILESFRFDKMNKFFL